ncbi:class I SAM-dependent methyltransferase [Halobacterium zhouii]|uniref:class I SAM-dependent methyltransferase n=1 Tax=Halobacterium zhouii TaxID=2902624 RepID=UPI001E4F3ABC|nr:class I SAM-dependent methyltransferase [Halobacterium zhouii]
MRDRQHVRRGYDELAGTYAEKRTADDRELTVLDQFLDDSTPERVLDAGCGPGTPILRQLSEETTASAVGLDLSRELLRIAADAVSAAPLVHGDMTHLPFQDGAFDVVLAFDSVIHVPLGDHQTVIDEFARVLHPGGRILLSEAPEAFERSKADWLGGGVEMAWHMAGAETTREQFRAAGFRVTDEWEAPAVEPGENPKPPFFAARLEG